MRALNGCAFVAMLMDLAGLRFSLCVPPARPSPHPSAPPLPLLFLLNRLSVVYSLFFRLFIPQSSPRDCRASRFYIRDPQTPSRDLNTRQSSSRRKTRARRHVNKSQIINGKLSETLPFQRRCVSPRKLETRIHHAADERDAGRWPGFRLSKHRNLSTRIHR